MKILFKVNVSVVVNFPIQKDGIKKNYHINPLSGFNTYIKIRVIYFFDKFRRHLTSTTFVFCSTLGARKRDLNICFFASFSQNKNKGFRTLNFYVLVSWTRKRILVLRFSMFLISQQEKRVLVLLFSKF